MTDMPDPWPLWQLELRTPRLTLRPDDDAGLHELMAEACLGVHPAGEMPFTVPWTEAPPDVLVREGFKHHWRCRVACAPDRWDINFLVRYQGKVIGSQAVHGKNFAVTREIGTGSWIGMRHQGMGIGTEMRAAVLMLGFDHLGMRVARSEAHADNAKSHGVSARLGYEPDGTFTSTYRDQPVTNVRLKLTPERFDSFRPDWKLEVSGLDAARPALGLA
jgi:RimJ/RimL family protein N-acetyltransferase